MREPQNTQRETDHYSVYSSLDWNLTEKLSMRLQARYVRGYSKGSSQTAINCWQEIEVYALPAK